MPSARRRKTPEKAKAEKATIARRVEEVLRLRLDGAQFWDIREYVREKEAEKGSAWELRDGLPPLSDSAIQRYLARTDPLIAASLEPDRKKLLQDHLAKRDNLYAKSTLAGDYRTALAVLRDTAELIGMYPAVKATPDGKGGVIIQTVSGVEQSEVLGVQRNGTAAHP